MRYTGKLIACLMVPLLASCESLGLVQSDYCLKAFPIYISHQDMFTDGTARPLLKHNKTWQAECDK